MSTLLLVRHAQASFLEDDYDRLSAHGEQQAIQLGDHWAANGISFGEVVTGPRQRHRRTAELVGQSLKNAGLDWPEPTIAPEWDEHQVDRLLIDHALSLSEQYPNLKPLVDAAQSDGTPQERARRFQRLFEATAQLWLTNAATGPGVETWGTFRDRIRSGLRKIVARPGSGRRVAVFTSVGAVTVALQHAMGCDDQTALATGWRVWNCSVTEFAFSGDRFTLDRFNALPHLPNPDDWTYR